MLIVNLNGGKTLNIRRCTSDKEPNFNGLILLSIWVFFVQIYNTFESQYVLNLVQMPLILKYDTIY